MKKRILSIVLAVLMLVSVLPTTALATEGGDSETPAEQARTFVENEKDDVYVKKSVNGNTLTLEAYATNSVSTHTSYEPLDIVLVLDVSGSMDDTIVSYKYTETTKKQWSCNDIDNSWNTYYYKDNAGNYQRVDWDDEGGRIFSSKPYRCWITAGGKQIGNKVKNGDAVSYHGKLYTRENTGEVKKIVALKNAVNTFIDSVAKQKDSKGNAIANKISIVKFAGDKTSKIGNDTYNVTDYFLGFPVRTNTYNHTQIVKELTRVDEAGKTELTNAVKALKAMGATAADFGMQLAKSVLDGRAKEDKTRKSVVIMFTDGEPNHDNGFDHQVASDAIVAAKGLKQAGTLVYTIGMFTGANPSSTADAINKYMHAVSSNYPKATAYTNLGEREKDSNYYLTALNAGDLDDVFQTISQDIGTLTAKIDDSSVLSDTLSDMFDFAPVGEQTDEQAIKVYTQKVKGFDDATNNYTWEDKVEATGVNVKVTDKKLEVKGFDYGANAVTTTEKDGKVTYKGYKLVVTIPIKPDTEYHGWADGEHYYDTNSKAEGKRAGLTYGDKNAPQKVELNDSPKAPVTAYTVSYSYTNGPTSVEAPKDRTAYIAGQTADVIEQTPTSVTENGYAYTFGGWKIGGEPAGTTIPITDHNVTITGNWTKEALTTTVTITKEFVAPEGVTNFEMPTGLTLKLVPNDTSKDPIPLTQVEGESRYTASGVPAGTYTVVEENETVDGYTCNSMLTKTGETPAPNNNGTIAVAAGGTYTYNLTNTYAEKEPETINITVTKAWVNADGEYDKKPVVIELYNGTEVAGTVTLRNETWSHTFTGLPADGTYSVKEVSVGGATFNGDTAKWGNAHTYHYAVTGDAADGFTVTNTLEKLGLTVEKTVDKDPCKVGDKLTYTITVMNDGNVALTGIVLTDTFNGKGTLYKDSDMTEPIVRGENNQFVIEEALALEVNASKTYTFYYQVDNADEGTIRNSATAAYDGLISSQYVETSVDRGDVDGYKVTGWIMKTVESKKGTFKNGETFRFDIWADEDCTDWLGEGSVVFNKTVKEGESYWIGDDFSFQISENNFKKLKEIDGHEVIYVTERKGNTKGMTYDSKVVTMYLREPRVVVNSLNIVDSYEATTNLILDEAAPAEFTNVYKKPADKGETIKSGPQLNRDDHVAYIMGYPDGTVQPEGEITRAEACTIFFRLLTDSSRDYYFARTNDYSDVNRGDWFNNAISTLSNAGIVTGYNDGTFRPNQPITRGEMAKIIANFANLKYGGKTFTDLAGHWSKSYVELAAGNGWIAGYPDGSFRPDQKITRAETVTMINRVLDRVPAKESRLLSRSIMLTFPDNKPGDWYYIAIQEASNSHEYQRSVYETTGDEMWTKLIDNVDWTKLEK